jgi:hypothetical protein
MAGRIIRLTGFRLDKNGKLVRATAHLNVPARIRQRKSKQIKVVKPPRRDVRHPVR